MLAEESQTFPEEIEVPSADLGTDRCHIMANRRGIYSSGEDRVHESSVDCHCIRIYMVCQLHPLWWPTTDSLTPVPEG